MLDSNAISKASLAGLFPILKQLRTRAGLTQQQIGNYRSIITTFLNVAETTEPGSTARAQRVEEITHCHEQPYIDQTLLHRLARLVLDLRDGKT